MYNIFQPSDSTITAVLDTNVLISYLHLIQKLVQTQIQQHRRDVTLLIPGIVIQELDGLRARKESVSNAARRANDWLLPLVNRVPCLRGQKTTDSPRGNWMHNREGVSDYTLSLPPADRTWESQFQNDDLVLECANHYIASCALTPGELIRCSVNDQADSMDSICRPRQVDYRRQEPATESRDRR